MGDPRHIIDQSYNQGSGFVDGVSSSFLSLTELTDTSKLFPRQSYQLCDYYADKIQAYCDIGDPFCDRGAVLTQHLDYTLKYNAVALQFVNRKLRE